MIRPTIVIKIYEGIEEVISEVLAGIEEEGVLCEAIETKVHQDELSLAIEAAEMSQLEVGIGICGKKVCLTVHKLGRRPLMITQSEYRQLGQNAARYVKGNSFTKMIGGEL